MGIDLQQMEIICQYFASRKHPLVIQFNCGTTMGHGIDDIKEGSAIVERISKQYEVPYWIHVDAALHGVILPFVDK